MATSMLGTGGVSIPTLDLDVKFQASSEVDSLKKIVKTIQDKRLVPVFLFDEANTLLSSKLVLDCLVKFTKQTREITVLLASSEYSFLFRLNKLDLNLSNITRTIFAGEVPPLDMIDLLQNKWGIILRKHLSMFMAATFSLPARQCLCICEIEIHFQAPPLWQVAHLSCGPPDVRPVNLIMTITKQSSSLFIKQCELKMFQKK
jgi:hypothetical protein